MTKELDRLMDMQAKDYTNEDVDAIIMDIRKQLAQWDAGIKPKREKETPEKIQEILAGIIGKPRPVAKVKRRM